MTNYTIGRGYEYKIRDYLKSLGYLVGRSAASRTAVDLFAASKPLAYHHRRLVIQVKNYPKSKLTKKDRGELIHLVEWAIAFDADPVLVTHESRGKDKWWTIEDKSTSWGPSRVDFWEMPDGYLTTHE